ncbi:hypothetical protein [Aliiglaciecola sp. LCG003]|uniref:hypothetical protein n=1 Tax=Aliiglaciecola sp. LCG003 TaxID=3053655 RepID=UPI0025748F1A|nr:hypothetical protein [Aliiglaciecola sp. LCG003]WJG08580.1 hypothetical protein QR722_14720 [Aliiglaciecola sp. LCG003]
MKYSLSIIASVLLLSGCANQGSRYQGEHLVIPAIEEIKPWQLFQKDENGFRYSMWQAPGERWANTFAVSVYYQQSVDLEARRAELDKPGLESCQGFASTDLPHPKSLAVASRYWQTQCEMSGKVVARMLHLVLQGRESFYHIQKIWKYEPTQAEFEAWQQRFEASFVCNLAAEATDCPSED